MGPIAFIIVFLLIPLATAAFAGVFVAGVGIIRLVAAVPTEAWAAATVGATLVVAARLFQVLHRLRPGRTDS